MTERRPSPLGGRKPTRQDLPRFATSNADALDDVLPDPAAGQMRLLIVGVNPGLWTAAVNAPFARPGNRFWPALHRAGLTEWLIDASAGLQAADERHLAEQKIGITNLVGRATVRADELTKDELRAGAERLVERVAQLRPRTVAIAGITAYRVAFQQPKAVLGEQPSEALSGWPASTGLWVVPQPSGLNAHENIATLAEKWRAVWQCS
ncbi:G/U mismatch-specific uracil-DNA glycosylase [Leucobacter luti]|uniref:G/U mismatch-specific uracil-DNA glycosylase n=1 Tax=Leucobacter luti TaxID=340320 RepID=A0A4R6S3S5_9MICO|nr:mismatch-specific DNA-glycosylase [Leucobacter luti]TDP94290.1 G/U mismatch-specific uracil-DNA glycosylase [Leucobacter luti]